MKQATFTIYRLGTTTTPEGFTLTHEALRRIRRDSPLDPPVPMYMIDWALLPHAKGDLLVTIQCEPPNEPLSVIRYDAIVR